MKKKDTMTQEKQDTKTRGIHGKTRPKTNRKAKDNIKELEGGRMTE